MVQRASSTQLTRWQSIMAEAITDPHQLFERLDLPPALLPRAERAARLFPLRVPLPYLNRIRRADPNDPLLRQVLPLGEELDENQQFLDDPVGDLTALRAPGLIQKYAGRALIVSTGACAIHCRYCFRRHFPYSDFAVSRQQWPTVLQVIKTDPTINEVIFSGGDPFSLSDDRLSSMVTDIAANTSIRRIRFHTRLPIVLPQRIDDHCLAWMSKVNKTLVIVIHANHPNELDTEVANTLKQLRDVGCTLLNQSVLLRGINDDAGVLAALSEQLFQHGVIPYYLHALDRVQGAAHFEVPSDQANALFQNLLVSLPGYLVPRFVREIPGAGSKTPITL